jgi:hypothetical protein
VSPLLLQQLTSMRSSSRHYLKYACASGVCDMLQVAAGVVRVHKAAAGVCWGLSQQPKQPPPSEDEPLEFEWGLSVAVVEAKLGYVCVLTPGHQAFQYILLYTISCAS